MSVIDRVATGWKSLQSDWKIWLQYSVFFVVLVSISAVANFLSLYVVEMFVGARLICPLFLIYAVSAGFAALFALPQKTLLRKAFQGDGWYSKFWPNFVINVVISLPGAVLLMVSLGLMGMSGAIR